MASLAEEEVFAGTNTVVSVSLVSLSRQLWLAEIHANKSLGLTA